MKCPCCEDGYICNCDVCDGPQWISIRERKPLKGQWVLVVCTDDRSEKIFHVGKMATIGNLFEIGPNPNRYNESQIFPATHWMPLPKEPDKDQK